MGQRDILKCLTRQYDDVFLIHHKEFIVKFRTIILLVISILATSCAQHAQEERTNIPKLKVISVVPQKEINAQFVSSTTGAASAYLLGGIPGAFIGSIVDHGINSSRAKKSEAKVQVFRELLSSYNFNQAVHDAYFTELNGKIWFETIGFLRDPEYKKFDPHKYSSNLDEEKPLLLSTDYSFDPDLNLIHVSLTAKLYSEASAKSRSEGKKYDAKKWILLHQSPSKTPQFVRTTPEMLANEIVQLKQTYSEKINNAKNSDERKYYKKQLRVKITQAQKRGYSIPTTKIVNFDWNKENLVKTLDFASKNLAKQLVNVLKNDLSKEIFLPKNRVNLPTLLHLENSFSSKKAYVLDKDIDQGYTTYITRDGHIYSLPSDEIIKAKSGGSAF